MTQPQDSAPPQLDALSPDTTLVTLGIGGNDLGLQEVGTRCVLVAYLAPSGSPCKTSYTLLGTDEIRSRIDATAPKIDAILQEIHARSPQARVLLVGYPVIMPDDGSACRDAIPFAAGDFAWFRDKEKELDSMLAQQASAYGATYVNTYTPSVGHDACKAEGVRWIEPKETPEAHAASTPTPRATAAWPPRCSRGSARDRIPGGVAHVRAVPAEGVAYRRFHRHRVGPEQPLSPQAVPHSPGGQTPPGTPARR